MKNAESEHSALGGRDGLIRAVLSCMAENGQGGTTVRAVAERANVTPGLVKHHFGNKNGLLVETYRHLNHVALERMSRALDRSENNLDAALHGIIKALFPDDLSDVHQMRIFVAFWGLVLTNPQFAEVQAQYNARMRLILVELIQKHAHETTDVAEIAEGIIALADGLWLECCMNPDRMTPQKATQIAFKFSKKNLSSFSAS